jgi:recombination protein RecA
VANNKVAPPFTEAEFEILYAQGISWEGSVLDAAIQHDLVTKRGSWLSYGKEQLGQGKDAAKKRLEADPAFCQSLIDQILEKIAAE